MDGGGVRTLASITFLKLLEKKLGVKIHEKFDFFIGTSAGAISCLALASKNFSAIDLEKIWAPNNLKIGVDYAKMNGEIFRGFWSSRLGGKFEQKTRWKGRASGHGFFMLGMMKAR